MSMFSRKDPNMTIPAHLPTARNLDDLTDSEMEAAIVSVRHMRELREKLELVTTERDSFRREGEIWRARAEANEDLLNQYKLDNDKLRDFKTKIVLRAKDLHAVTTEIMKEATDFALRPRNETAAGEPAVRVGAGDDGQPAPTFLTERHLQQQPEAKTNDKTTT